MLYVSKFEEWIFTGLLEILTGGNGHAELELIL